MGTAKELIDKMPEIAQEGNEIGKRGTSPEHSTRSKNSARGSRRRADRIGGLPYHRAGRPLGEKPHTEPENQVS